MAVSTESVAGIIAGRDPLVYESSNPITLFLFQAIFIIAFCQIVHIPLSFIRQPRVIAEVLSGIILGPTAFGKIGGFTNKCFPTAATPNLTLVANVGVILFLFLVGLEVDLKFIKKNIRIALSVGLVNMAIPFGFGCIISVGLYNEYATEGLKFTTFMVFIAVAMCITAFPVLARILTELRLLKDRVGTIVLAAGITNDIVGWMLLALSVTLANSGSGLTTLYIVLVVIGYAIFVMYPLRLFLRNIILKKDLQNGSLSRFSLMFILLLVFFSSFFTDIIGVHPIFGAFLIGLIVPREHGFVVDITNKIEDLVHIVLIPIYFAIAGFKADLTQIKTGKDWGYTVALILIAIITKVFGGFISSVANGLFWRESLTVGVLMSCKGIVEIVVLNVGLNAGIISSKVFSMFLVMMLISTFLTTPLTLLVYPQSYRDEAARMRKAKQDQELKKMETSNSDVTIIDKYNAPGFKFNKVIYNVENSLGLFTLLNFIELFYGKTINESISDEETPNDKILFNAVFLKELTERTSDLITAAAPEDEHYNIQLDLLARVFEFNGVPYSGELKYYVAEEEKLSVFLETSESPNDLMIFALVKEQLSAPYFDLLNVDVPSEVCFLVTSSIKTKINTLTVAFDGEHDCDSLIIYLSKLFISNNSILQSEIQLLLQNDQTVDFVDKYVKRLKTKTDAKITFISELDQVRGLFLVRYDKNNFSSIVESSKTGLFDIFAIN